MSELKSGTLVRITREPYRGYRALVRYKEDGGTYLLEVFAEEGAVSYSAEPSEIVVASEPDTNSVTHLVASIARSHLDSAIEDMRVGISEILEDHVGNTGKIQEELYLTFARAEYLERELNRVRSEILLVLPYLGSREVTRLMSILYPKQPQPKQKEDNT